MATARSPRRHPDLAAPVAVTPGTRRRRSRCESVSPAHPAVALQPAAALNPVAAESSALVRRFLSVAAIVVSSATLFSLELLAAQRILPTFGGSAGVWATALCFFTMILMGGYAYAHVLATRVGRGRAGIFHVGLAVAAFFAAILAPSSIGSLRSEGLPEALNVILVLTVIAGLPAFLFSTSTPLLSAWYGSDGSDPWWLYAASNSASLVAVLAYPFIIQPFLPVSAQWLVLVGAIGLFALLLVAIVVHDRWRSSVPAVLRGRPLATPVEPVESVADIARHAAPDRPRQLRWLALAFVPAGLLAATTNYITTDLISAPLLWIGPLAIYLSSFVIAFSEVGRRRVLPAVERLVPAAATLLWIPWLLPYSWPIAAILPLELASFAILAIAIHGRLASDRPAGEHLTRFYLVMSFGGVLATGFVALLAPLAFSTIAEYPLLIVAAIGVLAILPGPVRAARRAGPRGILVDGAVRLIPYTAAAVLFIVLSLREREAVLSLAGLLVAGGLLIVLARPYRLLAPASAALIVVLAILVMPPALVARRTFFGVTTVQLAVNGLAHAEYSGTTLHGMQFLDDRREDPTSYYVASGPFGDVFKDLAARTATARIGVVGLGTGTLATFARAGDSLTFYEIDPAVADIAGDPSLFSYLSGAAVKPTVVLGDGRLSLESVPPNTFDLLVLDAFSSDAVPAHLLTREALAIYERTMRPGGIIAFHVTNRYYALGGAVMATAGSIGLASRQLAYLPGQANTEQYWAAGSEVVVVGSLDAMVRFQDHGWGGGDSGPILTDDHFDLLRMLHGI